MKTSKIIDDELSINEYIDFDSKNNIITREIPYEFYNQLFVQKNETKSQHNDKISLILKKFSELRILIEHEIPVKLLDFIKMKEEIEDAIFNLKNNFS